jgi:hypothetical protein
VRTCQVVELHPKLLERMSRRWYGYEKKAESGIEAREVASFCQAAQAGARCDDKGPEPKCKPQMERDSCGRI